jgi:hypothetical protein
MAAQERRRPVPWSRRLAVRGLAALLLGCGGGAPDAGVPPGPAEGLTPGSVDFTVDGPALTASILVRDRTFSPTECAVVEGSIGASGLRRLLTFSTTVLNLGELDCVIGDPDAPQAPLDPADFEYHDCHGHRHMHGYASYELRTLDGTLATTGTKQGFCLLDNLRMHASARTSPTYHCEFQGLSSGWADIYARTVDGQWVDVTGLPEGDYVLSVTINAEGTLPELLDVHPNTVEVAVHLPDPSAPVNSDDDHGNVQATATPLAFPIGLVALIETPLDADWFRVLVTAGSAYTFRTELGTLSDSALRLVASNGSTLSTNDDVATGNLSSRIDWIAIFSGPVWIEVKGPGNATGSYRIVVE